MRFTSVLLYVNDQFPNKDIFDKLISVGRENYQKGKYRYSVECNFYNEDCFWMYFQYDNQNLYVDTVVDTIDNSTKENPRPKSQVELRFQLFACYSMKHQSLYVSDYSKKSVVSSYIDEMLQTKSMIKNVIISIDEYIKRVKFLKSVTFTQKKNIFNSMDGSILKKEANLYGLDIPDASKVKFDYGLSPIGLGKNILQGWHLKYSTGELEEIIVVGKDDSGFESSFNFSTLLSFVEIDSVHDENERHNPENVRRLLSEKLRI